MLKQAMLYFHLVVESSALILNDITKGRCSMIRFQQHGIFFKQERFWHCQKATCFLHRCTTGDKNGPNLGGSYTCLQHPILKN